MRGIYKNFINRCNKTKTKTIVLTTHNTLLLAGASATTIQTTICSKISNRLSNSICELGTCRGSWRDQRVRRPCQFPSAAIWQQISRASNRAVATRTPLTHQAHQRRSAARILWLRPITWWTPAAAPTTKRRTHREPSQSRSRAGLESDHQRNKSNHIPFENN